MRDNKNGRVVMLHQEDVIFDDTLDVIELMTTCTIDQAYHDCEQENYDGEVACDPFYENDMDDVYARVVDGEFDHLMWSNLGRRA